jgi:hypothetical protein
MAQVDFYSMLSGLGDTIAQTRKEAARREAFSAINNPDGTVDFNKAILGLTRAGDLEGAARIQQLAGSMEDRRFRQSSDARDFGFRQQESQRAQTNADRSFGLQQRQADEAARGFEYREVDDGVGGKTLVRIEKSTGKVSKPEIAGAPTEPSNPFMTGGKMNESQSKYALYTSRMLNAEKVLREPKVESAAQSTTQRIAAGMWGAGKLYNPNSVEFQKFDQAKRDFINATLRRESGAVISDAEFENAEKQYFPAPGDSKEVLAQKRTNRMTAIKGNGAGAGAGYRPDYAFDPEGNIIETAKKPPRVAPQGGGITKEQYDALPPGTPYTAPDGSQRVKK